MVKPRGNFMQEYQRVNAEASAVGDKNNCVVKAVAIVTGEPYDKVHKLFWAMGRRNGKGTPYKVTDQVLELLGVEYRKFNPNIEGYYKFTPKTIGSTYSIGKYLMASRSHMFALVDGVVEDWSAGRSHRIVTAYAIISINGVCAITGEHNVQ